MATAAVGRSKYSTKVPSWEKGVRLARTGWSSQAKTHTEFDEVLRLFLDSRDANGVKPNTRKLYDHNIGGKLFSWLQSERKLKYWQLVVHKDIEDFVIWLRNQEYSLSTVNQVLRCVRTLFVWMRDDPTAAELGLKHHRQAIPKLKRGPGRLWIPTPHELKAFMASFDQDVIWGYRDYVIASLIVACGARIGEVCNIKLADIKWEMGLLRLDGKTGERIVEICKVTMIPLLRQWVRVRERYKRPGNDWLFVTRNGGQCTNNAIGHEFNKLRKRSEVGVSEQGEITPHVLRHYYCTHFLVENPGAIERLMINTGHTDVETVMIYLHLSQELLASREAHRSVSPLTTLMDERGPWSGIKKKKRKMF